MVQVYLGLGANVGNREGNLRAAVRALRELGEVTQVSSLYQCAAMAPDGEGPGPDFLNAVCAIETKLDAPELLRSLKQIEYTLGRRTTTRWAPRPIDIDILLYEDTVIETPELAVPHPSMSGRAFVVVPMAEIAPEIMHPTLGRTIGQLAAAFDGGDLEVAAGAEWAGMAK